jgi:hypothetical protein
MLKFAAFTASLSLVLSVCAASAQSVSEQGSQPASAGLSAPEQSGFEQALESTAATGTDRFARTNLPPPNTTNTQYPQGVPWGDTQAAAPGQTRTTGTQGAGSSLPLLPKTVTGMPVPGSLEARGNLALQATGQTELQKTTLAPLASGGDEAVLGDEGGIYNEYSPIHRLQRIIPGELTTGHKNAAPPLDGF